MSRLGLNKNKSVQTSAQFFLKKLNAIEPQYWILGVSLIDMREQDTTRLEAILGWLEKEDRTQARMVECKQYRWIRSELKISWGWMRLVKRRRMYYEIVESLTESSGNRID